MKSKSYFDELELADEMPSKSREITLLVILTVLIGIIFCFADFLPIPCTLFIIYIFKDFKELTAKAILYADLLEVFSTLFWFNSILVVVFLVNVGADVFFVGLYKMNSYEVNKSLVFSIGCVCTLFILTCYLPFINIFMVDNFSFALILPATMYALRILFAYFIVPIGGGLAAVRTFKMLKPLIEKYINFGIVLK